MEATLELAGNAASNDPDIGLRAVAALRVLTEQLEILQVDNARALGWSWEKIARQLGGRRWVRRRVRRARRARWAAAPAGGGTRAAGPPGVPAAGEGTGAGPRRVPFTPRARKCLMHAVREARAEHTGQIGVEHLGLAIVSMTDGAVPPILSALGSSGPRLRAEILSRYRQAS